MASSAAPESEGNTRSADVQAAIVATFVSTSDISADVHTYES